ncbi:MAG: DUF4827 domain-containing protein [Staphylococcus sp.]|nr:DUF4827 domain-containing protein [Staphylococcus sp.]
MNKTLKYLIILICVLITACGKDDEPSYGLFHLTLGMEADADVAMGTHDAEITINGYAKEIRVGIVGEYDSFTVSDDVPSWMTVKIVDGRNFIINVSALSEVNSRTGSVGFTVLKGNKSQTGTITVVQNLLTLEDLQKTERRAIKSYLSKFDVIDKLPAVTDIQVGSVAPFYKLDNDGKVYMQVVKMGAEPAAVTGEKIYFRFLRYDLLYYLNNGLLPNGTGNMTDISQDATSFTLGSDNEETKQWGTALPLPMQIGLPLGSEVNLVVSSEAGITNEISSVIPYLYNIRYYKAQIHE